MKPVFAVVIAATLSCASADATSRDEGQTFVAYTASFADYRTWEPFQVGTPVDGADAGCAAHDPSASRVAYLNHRPPPGSTRFPVGTVIVKETQKGAEADWKVFAMVKRGGGYNAGGARDWEWFELTPPTSGPPTIIWRGVAPPTGEGYGTGCGGCNECHAAAAGNDFVQSPLLDLSSF